MASGQQKERGRFRLRVMGEPSERSLNTYEDSKTFFIWIKVSGTILLPRALFLMSYGFLFMYFLEIKDTEAKCKSE